MNLISMDVSKSFWSGQFKKFELGSYVFFTENFAGVVILNLTL